MLKTLRSLFSSASAEKAKPAQEVLTVAAPAEIQFTGAVPFQFASTLQFVQDLPVPDWSRVNEWLDALGDDKDRAIAWSECELAWLQHMRNALGSQYRLTKRNACLILSTLEERSLNAVFDFMARTSWRMARVLDGVAKIPEWGHDILIVFDDQETYYRYVSRYYPDTGEFSFSGGMHIGHGCSHFATMESDLRALEPVIAHEMAHGYLGHLSIPAWLNEGIAVNAEHRVTEQSTPLYTPQQMHEKHVRFWGEAEIQEFWSGQSFIRADDGNMLSYDLARILVAHFSSNWNRFRAFVCAADIADSGAMAAVNHLDIRLGAAVASIFDKDVDDAWEPDPSAWPAPPEYGAFYPLPARRAQ